jgi:ketosteroid isomerase-like protein
MRIASILSIIIVSLAVPAFADEMVDLKKATDQFDATYIEGFNKRDAAIMATHFTANAIAVIPRGVQTDVRKLFEGVLKAGFDHAEVRTDQFWSLGPNTAIGTGQSHYTGKNQNGAPIESSNFWTATYVKEDGKWKIRMLTGFPKAPPAK